MPGPCRQRQAVFKKELTLQGTSCKMKTKEAVAENVDFQKNWHYSWEERRKMIRKITVNIMAVILTAGMFLGATGVVIPEPVHAGDNDYYEITFNIDELVSKDSFDSGSGEVITDQIQKFILIVGGKRTEALAGKTATISDLPDFPTDLKFIVYYYDGEQNASSFSGTIEDDGGRFTFAEDGSISFLHHKECTFIYNIAHYHRNTHRWQLSAGYDVITAHCIAEYDCPLFSPTLTLKADDKEYDGKPVTASMIPDETWKTENGLPEISEGNYSYSPGNSKNAGTYTASYTLEGVTATKQFTIKKRPVIVGGIRINDKDYDGSMKATVDTSKAAFIGLVSGDDLKVKVTGEFEDAEPGNNKTVYLTYKLTGADAGNY